MASPRTCQDGARLTRRGGAASPTPRGRRALARLLPCLTLPLLLAGAAGAQQSTISLNDLAVDWARGRFASPLVCSFDEEPVRGMRRVTISAGPRHARPRYARVQFKDIEAEDASRCISDLGHSVPNVLGSVEIHLAGTAPRDTAMRDFKSEMRRNHGFEFVVASGRLRIEPIGDHGKAQIVDFQGGTARLFQVRPGSDAARLLADFQSPRKLTLSLEAKDGTRLEVPIFMTDFR